MRIKLVLISFIVNVLLSQTGSIRGVIKSANNQTELQGSNVLLLSTNVGSVSDSNGIYIIPNIRPGIYSVRVDYIGYKKTTIKNINVYSGQTAVINFMLEEEVLETDEITIYAERETINPEISTNSINLDASNIENIPISSIEELISLQAGIEPNMTIRGGNINSTSFVLDGINIRDGRTNGPITGLSLTSVEQIQIQTSGFDASFGNVRSGLVQLITKDPPKDRITGDVLLRKNSYQALNFPGKWNTIYNKGNDVDLTIGGPINQSLGNQRFLFSYRDKETPYLEKSGNELRKDESFQLKFISNIRTDLKLTLNSFFISQKGISDSISAVMPAGVPSYTWGNENDFFKTEGLFKSPISGTAEINHRMVSGKLSRTLSPSLFYELNLDYVRSNYLLYPELNSPIKDRDTSYVTVYSGKLDITKQYTPSAQFKAGIEYIYHNYNISSEYNDAVETRVMAVGSISNLIFGDNIDYESPYRLRELWTASPQQGAAYIQGKLSYSQMIMNLGVRVDCFSAGGEKTIFTEFDQFFTQQSSEDREDEAVKVKAKKQVEVSPRIGISFPITEQTKFYFNYGHFHQAPQAQFLYRVQEKSFTINRSSISSIGNPDLPMQRTIAYEVGYEHMFTPNYLFQLSSYSRSVDNQISFKSFISNDMIYTLAIPNNYNDIRGLELTLTKTKGRFFKGFFNYTYMDFSSGNFGITGIIQNPLDANEYNNITQDHYQVTPVTQPYARANLELHTPKTPQFSFISDWYLDLLAQWRAGKVFTWSGPIIDQVDDKIGVQYTPHPTIKNNMRTKDFYTLDLRLSKKFDTSFGSIKLFLDISNPLNLKFMYFEHPFVVSGENPVSDYNDYMASLHLPNSAFNDLKSYELPYMFIAGDDRPGDYPKDNVKYVPINIVRGSYLLPPSSIMDTRDVNELYYIYNNSSYMQFVDGEWQIADPEFVQKVLVNKAYINMPDNTQSIFLNPFGLKIGVRVSF